MDTRLDEPDDTSVEEVKAQSEPPLYKRASFLGIGLAFFFAAAAFFSGLQVGSAGIGQSAALGSLFTPSEKEQADLSLFFKVWETLDDRFVTSASSTSQTDEERIWGAIGGLVDTYGDPYTVFLPPKQSELFEADIAGEFGGVGMEVGMRDGIITVIAPLPDTPSERAGVRSGDGIVKINGVSTEGMGVDEAVLEIRGEAGTEVALTLLRKDATELLEVKIVREIINIPTLETETKDGVFIIKLFNFSATSEAMMLNALRDFVRSGRTDLIIDLRGNPGGFLQSAVGIASYFLPTGKVVVREDFGPGKEEQIYRSLGRNLGKYREFEMAVLVDQGSASASEILAGALQEHGIAKLVGTRTFGKGSVQELIDLPNGSSLKVTIARWLTPEGRSISEGGLTPDMVVERTEKDREEKRDPQLDTALKLLKE